MQLPSPGFLIQAFAQVLRRFPATMLCSLLGVLALFVIIRDYDDPEEWVRTYMVCILGLPLLTGLVAFSESKGWDEKRTWIVQAAGLVALGLYWFTLEPKSDGFEYRELPGYFALILVAHLFVAVAPYLNDRPVRNFWEYNKELFGNIVIGAAFTFILFAGLSLAILAVDQLFNLDVNEKTYLRLFFVLTGIFNTSYFLFHFPKNFTADIPDEGYTAIFKNLCKYILIPIVVLYFLILYAYGFKILGTWTLPRGWVGSLVTGFSVAGIFTFLLNFYLPEQDRSPHVHAYRRWFWWILLPLTALLCLAIGKRISDYGVTETRFLVAQMGVWLALNCMYFLFSKKDNIKFIPISLALFALSWAFGPLSAKAVSERSQLARITHILETNGRMEGGKIKPGKSTVTDMESAQFESAIEFLDRRKRLEVLNPMLPMPVDSLPEASGYYGPTGKLRAWLGITSSIKPEAENNQISVYSPTPIEAVDIRGFASFKPFSVNKSGRVKEDKEGFQLSADGKYLEWYVSDGKTSTLAEKFDLAPVLKGWFDIGGKDNSYISMDARQRTNNLIGKKGTVRLVVETGRAKKTEDGLSAEYINGFMFTK